MTLDAVRPSLRRQGICSDATSRPGAALVGFAPVVGLAGAQGGYFPSAWGWATLPLLWLAALALALRERIRLSGPEQIFLGAAGRIYRSGSCCRRRGRLRRRQHPRIATWACSTWRESQPPWSSRGAATFRGCSEGLLAAICAIAAFSLATRLLPDRVGVYDATRVYRLAHPIGYWNGLAIFTGMGALLALGFAAAPLDRCVRLPPRLLLVLLLPTFYFTFGRGAWIALAAGLVAAVAVDPRRLQLLASLLVL